MPEIQGTETPPPRSHPYKQCLKYKVQSSTTLVMSSQTMPEIQGTETPPPRSQPYKQCLKYKVQKLHHLGLNLTNNA